VVPERGKFKSYSFTLLNLQPLLYNHYADQVEMIAMRKREYIAMVLIAVSAAAIVMAGVANVGEPVMGISAEGFSRLCSNVALVAIALGVWFKPKEV
jgi:hypothetical protein